MTSVPTHQGEKGSQHPAQPLGSSTTEQEDYAAGIMISLAWASPGDLALQAGKAEGRGREECVRFRHLRYRIKKTADSISSALQIPLLQEQQPWETLSPVSSAWKIPKAAKAGVCGKGGARGSSGNTAPGWKPSKSSLERPPLTALHSQPTAPAPQEPTLLVKEEFSPRCNLRWHLLQNCTESWGHQGLSCPAIPSLLTRATLSMSKRFFPR